VCLSPPRSRAHAHTPTRRWQQRARVRVRFSRPAHHLFPCTCGLSSCCPHTTPRCARPRLRASRVFLNRAPLVAPAVTAAAPGLTAVGAREAGSDSLAPPPTALPCRCTPAARAWRRARRRCCRVSRTGGGGSGGFLFYCGWGSALFPTPCAALPVPTHDWPFASSYTLHSQITIANGLLRLY
jgi:hypothetical protein